MKRSLTCFALFISLGANTMAHAEQYFAEIKSSENDIINKNNLDLAKRFILKNGQTCTWSNMYNNNPCFATTHYQFYLNPDPGGPNNNPQSNINCDPKIGDFNTLVIRSNNQQQEIVKDGKIVIDAIDTQLNFIDKEKVEFRSFGSKADDIAIIQSSEIAVKELLLAIKARSKSTPMLGSRKKIKTYGN
jgi:hypothetical protein